MPEGNHLMLNSVALVAALSSAGLFGHGGKHCGGGRMHHARTTHAVVGCSAPAPTVAPAMMTSCGSAPTMAAGYAAQPTAPMAAPTAPMAAPSKATPASIYATPSAPVPPAPSVPPAPAPTDSAPPAPAPAPPTPPSN